MRILEIISGAVVNGSTQHGLLLTRELARRGHTVTVVCRPQSWIGGELSAKPVEVVESDLHRWPLDELWRIARIVRHKQIEVLHTHSSGAHTFGVLLRWLSGVPCVATAHAENRHWHWGLNDRVIAVSEATRHFLRTHTYARHSRIEVIPNFVCPARFASVLPHTRVAMRTSFGIPPTSLLLGFVGSLYHGKGWDDLIQVFAQVREAEPDTRLLAVGDGEPAYCAALRQEATRLGVAEHIIWAGLRSDIPEVLSAVDIFVSPSRQETFGLSVLEAMAAGCPVVATAVGGLPELVCHEETGVLVPLGDLVALRHALVTLIRDERQRRTLGDAGQRRAQEYFTPEMQLPRLEESLARTIRSRQSTRRHQ